METAVLEKKFDQMGARVKLSSPRRQNDRAFSIDIRKDELGEFFDLQVKKEVELLVLDLQKSDRHLLLLAKDPENKQAPKQKFLCGHDERNWFTCAIPERAPVSTVFQAKQALKPAELQDIEAREGLKRSKWHKRHRKLGSGRKIHRQGEFMFIPETGFSTDEKLVLKHEPMRRGNGNSHWAEYLCRMGGRTVYVSSHSEKTRQGLTQTEFDQATRADPKLKMLHWRIMRLDATVYVKGRITHSEHSTLDLGNTWHRVLLNTEDKAWAAQSVRFLD